MPDIDDPLDSASLLPVDPLQNPPDSATEERMAAGAGGAPPPAGRSGGVFPLAPDGALRALVRWETVLFVLLAAVIVTSLTIISVPSGGSGFLSDYNLFQTSGQYGELAIMALPLTFIIITGEIDLSVASTLGVANAVLGQLYSHHWPLGVIFVVVLLVGAVAGAFNGFLVTKVGLPSLAVTIGTLTLYRGIDEIVLRANTVSGFPTFWTNIGVEGIPHIPWLAWSAGTFLVLAVIFGVVLHLTPLGRALFAIGSNKEAAAFAGIRVQRIKFSLFVVSGVICSLAGILYTFRTNTAVSDSAVGLELSVVVMALLGGVSIFGGTGTIVGVVLAVLVFGGLTSELLLTNFNEEALPMVWGGLLLLSVLMPNLSSYRRRGRESLRRYQTRGRAALAARRG